VSYWQPEALNNNFGHSGRPVTRYRRIRKVKYSPCIFASDGINMLMSISRQLRIIAIPLTRPNVRRILPHPKAKPSGLVYYQFQSALEPPALKPLAVASGNRDSYSRTALQYGLGASKWVTNKEAYIWAGFGRGKSGWKVCILFSLAETR
jgi:hypothetical protein